MMITTNNNEKYQCYLPKIVKNDKKINVIYLLKFIITLISSLHYKLNFKEDETGNVPLELELLQPLIYSHMCFYKVFFFLFTAHHYIYRYIFFLSSNYFH